MNLLITLSASLDEEESYKVDSKGIIHPYTMGVGLRNRPVVTQPTQEEFKDDQTSFLDLKIPEFSLYIHFSNK